MSDTNEPRDRRLIASAALIGLIVIAGIVLVTFRLTGGGDEEGPNAGPAPSATPAGSAGDQRSSSACGLPDSQDTALTDAPDAEWKILGTSAVPQNESTGPAQVEDDIPRCFARSPEGALFAATWLTVLLNEPRFASEALVRSRMVPGPALDAFLASDDGGATTKIPAQIAGFRIEDYSPDRSTVSVIARLTDGPDSGGLLQIVMTMVWQEGDWKWELSSAGIQGNAVTSLSGFVPWSGVS
ncbi:hypothetical protein [Aeromicrobium yanjiei]|uniref:DUF8175 domain-containing protein n=1 Tax=Aeromicrobium yanjiei TaxID=2662028 RepID=A0A5Q2MDY8_9ACTN|nr:hypothetical protein [Aeromicrobium yanjiei]QGG39909.1 hypothetical protein GEV26_00135 [Aeromicrobium yanjiei]